MCPSATSSPKRWPFTRRSPKNSCGCFIAAPTRPPTAHSRVGGLILVRRSVAAYAAGAFLALDLGKQPHREDHEEAEKGHDILDAFVPERMLIIGRNRGHQHDERGQAEFDSHRH